MNDVEFKVSAVTRLLAVIATISYSLLQPFSSLV